ncbi:MAG: hypothetical protein AAGD28_21570 [Bacteroidota bacterium]
MKEQSDMQIGHRSKLTGLEGEKQAERDRKAGGMATGSRQEGN